MDWKRRLPAGHEEVTFFQQATLLIGTVIPMQVSMFLKVYFNCNIEQV